MNVSERILADGEQLGHYNILYLIGTAGIGNLYLAKDRHSHQQVAIKILRTEFTTSSDDPAVKKEVQAFLREAKAISMLNHPHILPLYDYGEASIDGSIHAYLAMPFRSEGSLYTWMRQRNALFPLQDVVLIVNQAAQALQYAHDHQIIHRDVKPSNFLIRRDTGSSDSIDLLLTDFKLATFMNATIDVSQSPGSSGLAYIAPEQWDGTAVYATDQYALAVVAYELLTNRTPHQDGTEQAIKTPLDKLIASPSTINPAVPEQVDLVLLRALEKNPEDRYPSISEFANALQEASKKVYTNTTLMEEAKEIHANTTLMQHTTMDMPGDVKGNDIHVQVAISKDEAKRGTARTLGLPGGRSVAISIPARTSNGQVIRLDGQGEPSASGGPTGALIVTVITNNEPSSNGFFKIINSVPRTRTTLLVGLLLLVLLNSVALLLFNNANRASAMAQAYASITATAQVRNTIARAVNSTATTQANATATVVGSQYPFSNTIGLDDPLTANTKGYGWEEDGQYCEFTGGAYHTSAGPGSYSVCIAANKTFNNFTFQVQMTIINGDCGGILFRGNTGSSQYYLFIVCQDGSYALSLHTGAQHHVLATHASTAINKGLNQFNIIAVTARGDTVTLYANNQVLDVVQDNTYDQGQVGFLAYALQSSTEVNYTNAKVWIL